MVIRRLIPTSNTCYIGAKYFVYMNMCVIVCCAPNTVKPILIDPSKDQGKHLILTYICFMGVCNVINFGYGWGGGGDKVPVSNELWFADGSAVKAMFPHGMCG